MSELVAYHEAGHAVVAWMLGGRVRQVTIEPDGDDGLVRSGDTQVAWKRAKFTEKQLASCAVQVSLAGPVAEMIYSGDPYHPGLVAEWSEDWRQAWDAAGLLQSAQVLRLEYLEHTTLALYRQLQSDPFWAAIASLADNLLAHETLDREQVEDVLREWLA